jgi:ABC-2 type transport system permease protein
MSPAAIRLAALTRREVSRFMKIKGQTIGAPLLETFLYITVFGAALGTRVGSLDGVDYVVFVVPGLIMMAWAINAFSNNSSSILQQKFQRAIDDQLSSPASPLQLLVGFSLGGFLRGMIIAAITFVVASFLIDLPVEHVFVLIPSIILVGFFFSQVGVLVGVRAEQFDDVSFAQTFILTPLIFLGGVFYSASLLPEPLHDHPGPVRIPRHRRRQRGPLPLGPDRRHHRPLRPELPAVQQGLPPAGVNADAPDRASPR